MRLEYNRYQDSCLGFLCISCNPRTNKEVWGERWEYCKGYDTIRSLTKHMMGSTLKMVNIIDSKGT